MEKRKEDYEAADKKYRDAKVFTTEADAQAQKTIDDARQEAAKIAEEAQKKAFEQRAVILAEANEQAEKILADARTEAKNAVSDSKEELYLAAKDMAYDVAEKLLARDIKTEDNDAFIDAILSGAKKKDVQDA